MSFTYTTGIPAAGNNPSNDQPNMLQNTNAISNLLVVDHIGFNDSDAGQHKKISFNDVASPGSPTDPLSYLYTVANVAGFSWPTFLNEEGTYSVLPDPPAASTGSGSNGLYTCYSITWGKLILNFGTLTINSGSATSTATFQTTFTNSLSVLTSKGTAGGGFISVAAASGTPFDTLTVTLQSSPVSTITVSFLVIGS